ncbi:hypothetical protein [Cohaesibacter gelatinilyticus]|uniref:hypothetical protein n=1 Tax=Cohaesibacter gelatinilyticus TaxID=372072 RepID=UPI001482FB99|nr:hypothetical protein [Cohaesibacter gelatinilyticus]
MGQIIRNKSSRLALPSLPIDRATNLHFDRIAKVLRKLGWKLVPGSTTEFERVRR